MMRIRNSFTTFFLALILSFSIYGLEVELDKSFDFDGFVKRNYKVSEIKNLNNSSLPFFVYHSKNIDKRKQVRPVLFLHGRGFSRGLSSDKGMLDYLELSTFYSKPLSSQVVFIAPQDTFLHKDSNSVGQDYWIGIEGRKWPAFFKDEFKDTLKLILGELGIPDEYESITAFGISMGAHGAMLIGSLYPELYPEVYAFSPVFRTSREEMPTNDVDVFRPDDLAFMGKYNVGFQIMKGSFQFPKRMRLFTSRSDFALNKSNFPSGAQCLEKLGANKEAKHVLRVYEDDLGHSMDFWKKAFNENFQ